MNEPTSTTAPTAPNPADTWREVEARYRCDKCGTSWPVTEGADGCPICGGAYTARQVNRGRLREGGGGGGGGERSDR